MESLNLKDCIGQKVRAFFHDGRKVTPRDGTLLGCDDTTIFLHNKNGTDEAIPFNRIVRIEVIKNSK